MGFIQPILIASAALGVLASTSELKSRASHADLNINDVSDVAAHFSDVVPTDWAYQALSNLVEQYGCVAGYPNGTFRGNRAMTRYEAAALLNACLDRVTEVTDEVRGLVAEFETELAVLRGRVDGLEARVGELEATQFSTTTKLKGKSSFIFGATKAKGDNSSRSEYNSQYAATSLSYSLKLQLLTSFTGNDLLYTRLRSANVGNAFNGRPLLGALDEATNTNNVLTVDRFYYKFPLGSSFTVHLGPLARNTQMLGYTPSAYYQGNPYTLDVFGTALGTPGVWNARTGAGFGIQYESNAEKGVPRWHLAANYLADKGEGENSNPNEGGFITDNSRGNITSQIAYGNKQWGIALGYRYGQCDTSFKTGTEYAQFSNGQGCYDSNNTNGKRTGADSNSYSVHAFWKPKDSSIIPSISAGFGQSYLSGDFSGQYAEIFSSWMVGLQWSDVFLEGNSLGGAIGQGQFVSSQNKGNPDDGNYVMELWYNYQVTDNISITPAIYWLSRPYGDITPQGDSLGVMGSVVQTTFKF